MVDAVVVILRAPLQRLRFNFLVTSGLGHRDAKQNCTSLVLRVRMRAFGMAGYR